MATIQVKDANGDIKYLEVTGGAGTSGDPFKQVYKDDEYVGSQVTEDVFHYLVHEGLSFSTSTYATTGDLYICFTTPNTETYIHTLMDVSGEKNCALEVWQGVTAGATATEKVVYNKNRAAVDSGGASAVIAGGGTATVGSVQHGVAFSGGTRIYEEFQAKGSGGRPAEYELLLEKNTTYGFKVDNIDNADCGLNLTWFEVPHL